PFRLVGGAAQAAVAQRFDDLEALDQVALPLPRRLLAVLRLLVLLPELLPQVAGKVDEVELLQELLDRLGAHAGVEAVAVLLAGLAVLLLGEELALLERRLAGADDDVVLEVDDLLEGRRLHVQEGAQAAGHRLEEPDVDDRRGQLDVAHALAAHAAV